MYLRVIFCFIPQSFLLGNFFSTIFNFASHCSVSTVMFLQLQLFLSYLFIAESYQSENPINVMLMMSFLFYCGAVFMEVYLLSIVCWGATNEVHRISNPVNKSRKIMSKIMKFQFAASSDFLHGVFSTQIDEKLKRSVSRKYALIYMLKMPQEKLLFAGGYVFHPIAITRINIDRLRILSLR